MGSISSFFHRIRAKFFGHAEHVHTKKIDMNTLPPAPITEPAFDHDFSDRIFTGRRAEAMLTDPFFNAVLDHIAAGYRQELEDSATDDLTAIQIAHLRLRALKDVRGELRRHMGNAKLYEAAIERQRIVSAAKYPY